VSSVRIRTYRDDDREGVVAVILPIQQGEFGIPITAADQPDLADVAGFYQTGTGEFWVAEIDREIVGTVALKDMGNDQAALRKMFVAQAVRGKSGGVSGKLLDALLKHARQSGLTDIFLGTTDKFLAAHRFYEKNGFVEVAKSSLPAAFPVMAVDSKFYQLSLNR
jgi:N-acetylglutamate synthase-like GNAT family acetyltransferase